MDTSSVTREDPFIKARSVRYIRPGPLAPTTSVTSWELEEEKDEVRHVLKAKLQKMKAQYEGEAGTRFIHAIADSVGIPMEKIMHFPKELVAKCHVTENPTDCYVDAVQSVLMKRINESLAEIEKFEAKQEKAA